MQSTDRVHQRGPIEFLPYVRPNFNDVVGTNAEEKFVECRVMQRAKRQPIANDRLAFRRRVRNDVGRIEKLLVTELTERTLPTICFENAFPKCSLVKADTNRCGDIRTAGNFTFTHCAFGAHFFRSRKIRSVINCNRKHKILGVIMNDEYRPRSHVAPPRHTVKINERKLTHHRFA